MGRKIRNGRKSHGLRNLWTTIEVSVKRNKHLKLTKVINTKTMGRGVAALVSFKAGDIVETSPCLLVDDLDDRELQKTDLKLYVFDTHMRGGMPRIALALGNGSLFNHRKTANITYSYDEKSNCMIFVAIHNIKKGEQLFINYGYNAAQECKIQADRKERVRAKSAAANLERVAVRD
jgi:SET domain-containing protein